MEKQCSKCGEIKDVTEFYKQKKNKDGYNCKCKKCCKQYYVQNIDKIKECNKEWRNKNANKIKKIFKEWCNKNTDKRKENKKEWREKNADKIKTQKKIYHKQNADKIKIKNAKYRKQNLEKLREKEKTYSKNNRLKRTEYNKQRYKKDILFKTRMNITSNFSNSLKRQSIKKTMSTCNYTGINYSVYVEHFKNDPLWNDYCTGKNIHIDHIIPVSAYDFSDKNEIKKCWHYRNLRLLNGIENMSKNNKIDYDLIKQYGIEDLLPDSLLKAGIA